jgi:hypothetical protein
VADKPIIKIPVDTEEWDKFIDSYQNYNNLLEKQGDAWAGTNKGIRQQKTAFDDVDKSFSDLVNKAQNPKFSGPNGSFVKVTKSSKETEKSWRNIARDMEKSSKSMMGIARSGLSVQSIAGLFGMAGTVATGLFAGNVSANNSFADQNILNRKLNLKPGEEKAFSTVYEKAGGDTALLAKLAAAQADPSQWRYLQAAGISIDDIKSKGTEALGEEFLQKVGNKVNELGPQQFGMWAQSQGVTNFGDVNSLRLAGSYKDADYAGMHQQTAQLIPQLAAKQKTLDEATAAKQQLEEALARDTLEFDKALIKLNPLILTMTGEATKWITAFAESDELKTDINNIETAFDKLAKAGNWLADKLDALFGTGDKDDPAKGHDAHIDKDGLLANLIAAAQHPIDYFSGKDRSTSGWDIDIPGIGTKAWNAPDNVNPSTGNASMDALLDATKEVESHGKANAVGPVTKEGWTAKGAYQFSPADLDRYNVADPFDQKAERGGAARKYADLAKEYKGNIMEMEAAYNWGEGNLNTFLKDHHGNFDVASLPPGVQDYLEKMNKALVKEDAGTKAAVAADAKVSAAAKSKADIDPKIVPMDSVDEQAMADSSKSDAQAVTESFTDRMMRAAGMVNNLFSAGGLASARGDQTTATRIDRQGNQPMTPYKIEVQVHTQAGNSTTVTAGGIAQ